MSAAQEVGGCCRVCSNMSRGYVQACSDLPNTHPCVARIIKITAVVTVLLVLAGLVLFTYMHLSGLEVSRAGLSVVGNRIIGFFSQSWDVITGAANQTHLIGPT